MAKKPAARRAKAATSAKSKAPAAEAAAAEPETEARAQPMEATSNCTDETKRRAYLEAMVLYISMESARDVLKSKTGVYRSYLKAANKRGVSSDAITFAIANRETDPELLAIAVRERIKLSQLGGNHPGLFDKIASRFDVYEPTLKEEEENQILIAVDRGMRAGRNGHERDGNPYEAGSIGHVKWVEGYIAGQRIIAEEMAVDDLDVDLRATPQAEPPAVPEPKAAEPAAKPANRNPLSQSQKAAEIAASLSPDRMPGGMPGIVH